MAMYGTSKEIYQSASTTSYLLDNNIKSCFKNPKA
jgi:hypothetical protein